MGNDRQRVEETSRAEEVRRSDRTSSSETDSVAPWSNSAAIRSVAEARSARVAPDEALRGLLAEAERLSTEPEEGVSTAPGITHATVPLHAIMPAAALSDPETSYDVMVADVENAQALAVALARDAAISEYLEGKLDWPVAIGVEEHGGDVWFTFAVNGEDVIASRTLELPMSVLNTLSTEPLDAVIERASRRATQLYEIAVLDAALPEILAEIGDKPDRIIDDLSGWARNEVQGIADIAAAYEKRLVDLGAGLDSTNEWARPHLDRLMTSFHPVGERAKLAATKAFTFWHNNMPDKAYGEVYNEAIADAGTVEAIGWRFWRGVGNIVTGGGQSLDAENAGMYRRGEISLDDFESNRRWNIARVGVTAAITALTAGRASGPAMRLLGLEAGTAAGAVAAGGAEGVVGGVLQSISSDVFAAVVASTSDSAGVRAFHERTIGGPRAWVESGAYGGMFGMGGAAFGAALPKGPPRVPGGGAAAVESNALVRTEGDALVSTADDALAMSSSDAGALATPDSVPAAATPEAAIGEIIETPMGSMRVRAVYDGGAVLEPLEMLPDAGSAAGGTRPPIDLWVSGYQPDGTPVYSVTESSFVFPETPEWHPPMLPPPDLALVPHGGAFGTRRGDLLPGNIMLTQGSTGASLRSWQWFEQQISRARRPSVQQLSVPLQSEAQFPGRDVPQAAVEPDITYLDLSGTTEVKMRNWTIPQNVDDAVGTLARNIAIHEQAARAGNVTARNARIELVTHNEVPALVKKQIVHDLVRWMRGEGYAPADIVHWLGRIQFTRERFEFPR